MGIPQPCTSLRLTNYKLSAPPHRVHREGKFEVHVSLNYADQFILGPSPAFNPSHLDPLRKPSFQFINFIPLLRVLLHVLDLRVEAFSWSIPMKHRSPPSPNDQENFVHERIKKSTAHPSMHIIGYALRFNFEGKKTGVLNSVRSLVLHACMPSQRF